MPLERDKFGGFKFALNGAELQQSFYPDQFARAVPWWETGQNVQFTDLGMRKREGYASFADTGNGEPIRGVLQYANSDGTLLAYVGDLSKLYEVDIDAGTVTEKGSGYTLSEDGGGTIWDSGTTTWDSGGTLWDDGLVSSGHWSFTEFGSFILATNGVDAPQIKKTDGKFTNLYQGVNFIAITSGGTGYAVDDILTLTGGDGSGATARVLAVDGSGVITSIGMESGGTGYTTVPTGVSGGTGSGATFTFAVADLDVSTIDIFVKRGPHILGFNTSNSEKEFVFSDADDVDVWQTASDNLAGVLQIRELKGPIRAAVPLGQSIAVYGDEQMLLVNYLQNELVFGYRPTIDGVGAVSKYSVVPVGRRNYGLTRQGFYVTDGAQFQYIDTPIRRWFRENVAIAQLSKAIGFHDEKSSNVRWYFPTDDVSVNVGVSFNYEKNLWTLLTDDKTAGEERILQENPITGDSTGKIFRENSGNNSDDSATVSFARTKPLDLQSADQIKEVTSLRLGWKGTGMQFRMGWSETEDGTITWDDYADANAGFAEHHLRVAGRYLFMEAYSATLNADWELTSVEMIGRVEGSR